MARRRSSRRSSPHTLPIVASLIVFLTLFLTVYILLKNNTDVRSRADVGSQGIGQTVREEMSPAVRVTTPTANAVLTNPVIVTADIPSGFDVERVQFWVDTEKEPANEVFEAPFETSLTLSSGRHRLHVIAFDASGNAIRSQEVPFQVR